VPGDRIVGIVTTGHGVTVHTIDCEALEVFDNEAPERWLDLTWDVGADVGVRQMYVARLNVSVVNKPGSLGDLSVVIGKNGGNISNLKITHREADFFDMVIDIEVPDVKHLNATAAALRATPSVNTVRRPHG
jgi:GTP pyrophosphokinase